MVEAYGARLAVSAPDAEVLRIVLAGLPRGWTVCDDVVSSTSIPWRFAVLRDGSAYRVQDGDGHERACSDLDLAIWMLRTQMRRFVGYHSSDLIFVHAGVVAYQGVALLLPGHSFAGKSTLVEALVRAGAEFYSDEYALLDKSGRVDHYREPLLLRSPEGQKEVDLGSSSAREPAVVGLVAFTFYTPGAVWSPREISKGEGVLAMMEHSIPARDRPSETLSTLRLAVTQAQIVHGERGEADEAAQGLLGLMTAAAG